MSHVSLNIGYWATVEHAATWQVDAAVLQQVADNDGLLSNEVTKKIAGIYKVARSLKGVAANGYGPIADILNAIELAPRQTIGYRVGAAVQATCDIAALGAVSLMRTRLWLTH